MSDSNNVWPSPEELDNVSDKVELAPYGVISFFSDLLFQAYNEQLLGIITTRAKFKPNGDKTDFVYSLVLSQIKNDNQIKIFEVDIQDDGWYPATLYLTKPNRELIGRAENEAQLRKYIENCIKTDFVKENIKILLRK